MNTTHRIRHFIGILAAGACALLAFAATSPARAETTSVPHYGPPANVAPAQAHTVIVGGMPGWQIALIALAAALCAATVAVVLDRARPARPVPASAAPGPRPGSRRGPGRTGRTPTAAPSLPSRATDTRISRAGNIPSVTTRDRNCRHWAAETGLITDGRSTPPQASSRTHPSAIPGLTAGSCCSLSPVAETFRP